MTPLKVAAAGSVALVVLFYVCIPGRAVHIEQELLARARVALLRADFPADGLGIDGRDATLAGPRGSVQVSWQAVRVVSQVEGVRKVDSRLLEGSGTPFQPAAMQRLQRQIDGLMPAAAEFEAGKATLTASGEMWLTEVAELLKKYFHFPVEIQGNARYTGDAAVTMELSRRRAAAARIYLIVRGVAPTQLTAVGYGQSTPKARPVDSESGEALRTRFLIKAPRE